MSQPTYLSEDTLYARLQQTTHPVDAANINRHSSIEDSPIGSDDLDSLDTASYHGGFDDTDTTNSYDADEEWEENKQQIQLLFSMIIFPYMGKFLGRKFSFYRKLGPACCS